VKKNGHRTISECGVREVQRRKVQRFYCCDCHRSFIARENPGGRISHEICEEIVRQHVEGGESYRAIARWIKRETGRRPSASSLQGVVEEVASRCKTAWEMSRELQPRWNGVVLLDEKMCPVRRRGQWLYLAVDTTGDIMHCRGVPELSSTEAASFLREVQALPVQIKGLVSDLDPALTRAVEVVCAGIPHQYCIKHALAAIGLLIGYVERDVRRRRESDSEVEEEVGHRHYHDVGKDGSGDGVSVGEQRRAGVSSGEENVIGALYETCRKILAAPTEREARERYDALCESQNFPARQHRKAVRFLTRRWDHLMMHHRLPGLPRTTNLVENVNKQLQRRYKTIEAFQYRSTAIHYTNLLVAFLRQKPYTDCRGSRKHLNGKSRLASARVRNLHLNWLKNCLKSAV
jgi:transposase-like protein